MDDATKAGFITYGKERPLIRALIHTFRLRSGVLRTHRGCLTLLSLALSRLRRDTLRESSGLSAFLSASLSSIKGSAPFRPHTFGPSPPCATATMPSADFCKPIVPPLSGTSPIGRLADLPGYRAPTFTPSTRRIYSRAFRMTIGLKIIMPPRPDAVASYALRVPRARALPTTSFRPRLAAVALAVPLTVPVIRVRRGLSPPIFTSGETSW
jgi:hypothetical protein